MWCVILSMMMYFIPIMSCEVSLLDTYPRPANQVEEEIDHYLKTAENKLFQNEFNQALLNAERAESLLYLTTDPNDRRRLRILFDKAIIKTCLNESAEPWNNFEPFYNLLASKSCILASNSQPNLFDGNGNWPILGDNTTINVHECIDRVKEIKNLFQKACWALPVPIAARASIDIAINYIAGQAEKCCTTRGFWKTCLQPIIDAWKRVEIFGILPA